MESVEHICNQFYISFHAVDKISNDIVFFFPSYFVQFYSSMQYIFVSWNGFTPLQRSITNHLPSKTRISSFHTTYNSKKSKSETIIQFMKARMKIQPLFPHRQTVFFIFTLFFHFYTNSIVRHSPFHTTSERVKEWITVLGEMKSTIEYSIENKEE